MVTRRKKKRQKLKEKPAGEESIKKPVIGAGSKGKLKVTTS